MSPRKDEYQKGDYRRRMKKKSPAIDVMEEWLLSEALKASRGRDCTSVTTSTTCFFLKMNIFLGNTSISVNFREPMVGISMMCNKG